MLAVRQIIQAGKNEPMMLIEGARAHPVKSIETAKQARLLDVIFISDRL